jgi:NitT/TauT family transport system permease protein
MISLLWNAMMSFGGGWFFVAASEAISVLNQNYTLQGIGSYVTAAIEQKQTGNLFLAILTMAVVIVVVDQFFWRPLTAWASKFKYERSASADTPTSWVLSLIRTSRIPKAISALLAPVSDGLNAFLERRYFAAQARDTGPRPPAPWADVLFNGVLLVGLAALLVFGMGFVLRDVSLGEVGRVALYGLATFGRVVLLILFGSLIWTPVGVAIGFSPRLARVVQPIVQFLSSFPANFLFPFATLFFIRAHVDINYGGILLMALGAQWYILFNVIAGASRIPTELREMAVNMGLSTWQRWRKLIIPGIFTSWVTGGITAAGGAWNASIVAEMVSWGDQTLIANGLGAYIAQVTQKGDWPRIALGVGVMSLFVVGLNTLVWRRLYRIGESKYHLG